MTFMSNLAANPTGAGIYGQTGPESPDAVLGLVNRIKDRNMQDFMTKANFMSDLSLKQDRLRRLYDADTSNILNQSGMDPASSGQPGSAQPNTAGMNTVMRDPNMMTGYQKGELGIRQQGLDLESQKLAQQGKMGQQATDIRSAQERLNQQKSDQINANKITKMQNDVDESNRKLQIATQALNDKTKSAADHLAAYKEYQAAVEERHKAEMAQKQTQFDTINAQHKAAMDAMQRRLDQNANVRTTTQVNPEGTQRTTTTQRGNINAPVKNPDGSYHVIGPNGVEGDIPANKLDDWMQNHQPGQQDQQDNQQEENQ